MISHNYVMVHLSLVPGVGPITIGRIVAGVGQANLHDLYTYTATDFMQRCGLPAAIAQTLVQELSCTKKVDQEYSLLERHGFSLLTILDDDYPYFLKQSYACPPVLYIQGDASLLQQKSLAVVGSRKAKLYAQQVIHHIIPTLIQDQWAIVSGGAYGVDAMAHEQTLQAGGKTVVVLGSGLLKPYPRCHIGLFGKAVETGGAVVSCFPLQAAALPGNFPARNRIIAGLSQGCIVVQAARKSGALITALFALDNGRTVFAVPGPITDELSAGCHDLIRQGAILVTSAEEIIQEYNPLAAAEIKSSSGAQGSLLNTQELTVDQQIVQLCFEPQSIEQLSRATNLEMAELQDKLFNLQIENKISQNFMGLWERSRIERLFT